MKLKLMTLLKMFFTKLSSSIKGFYYTRKYKGKIKIVQNKTANLIITYYHKNNRNFYAVFETIEPTTGVVRFRTHERKLPYWTISTLEREIIE